MKIEPKYLFVLMSVLVILILYLANLVFIKISSTPNWQDNECVYVEDDDEY